jgi:putative hydrolase of HD superfamily
MDQETVGILDFSKKMQRLKGIQREGWIRAGVKNPESVADHVYACAVLSMIVGDIHKLDTERLIRMALLHDLPENITGDFTPREKQKLGRQARILEKRAASATLNTLPAKMRRKYLALMDEYWKQESDESKILRDIDKIEMALQAVRYVREGYPRRNLAEFLNSAGKELKTSVGRAFFEAATSAKRV